MVLVTHKFRFIYLLCFIIILRTKNAITVTTTGTVAKYAIDISERCSCGNCNEEIDIAQHTRKVPM